MPCGGPMPGGAIPGRAPGGICIICGGPPCGGPPGMGLYCPFGCPGGCMADSAAPRKLPQNMRLLRCLCPTFDKPRLFGPVTTEAIR